MSPQSKQLPHHVPSASASDIAHTWLAEMQACVRAVDYERCRAIFAEDAVGFGTRASMVAGLEALEQEQWRHIWGTIRNFTFQLHGLHCGPASGDVLWVACPWTSERQGADGEWHERPGRMTAVLERRNGTWLAVHTHHSLVPV